LSDTKRTLNLTKLRFARVATRSAALERRSNTSHVERRYKSKLVNCSKCRTKITTHRWVMRGLVYCSPSCERGAKSMFEKLYKALKQ
jgi:formamidopyrimidine-DNA glycosylase